MTTHISEFTSAVVVGAIVTGVSRGTASNGRRMYETTWSGTYMGVQTSEWTGSPVHVFTDGIIGETPQKIFATPVSQFPTDPAPLTSWCQTCGSEVHDNLCGCWAMVADTLQRYLGMDFDHSAQVAAVMWASTPQSDKERVWSAEYANDHDVTSYPDERAFAPADVRKQDALDHPHDESCPRCGRRTWGETDDGTEDTCQSCGYVMTWDDV